MVAPRPLEAGFRAVLGHSSRFAGDGTIVTAKKRGNCGTIKKKYHGVVVDESTVPGGSVVRPAGEIYLDLRDGSHRLNAGQPWTVAIIPVCLYYMYYYNYYITEEQTS
jgi:hypothetical protein